MAFLSICPVCSDLHIPQLCILQYYRLLQPPPLINYILNFGDSPPTSRRRLTDENRENLRCRPMLAVHDQWEQLTVGWAITYVSHGRSMAVQETRRPETRTPLNFVLGGCQIYYTFIKFDVSLPLLF
jgi:hypothetical protein